MSVIKYNFSGKVRLITCSIEKSCYSSQLIASDLNPPCYKLQPSKYIDRALKTKKMHVIRILWVSKWAGRRDGYGWLNALSMFLTRRVCLVIFLMQFVGVWKSSCLYTTTPYDHCGVVLSLLHFPKVLWCSEMVSTEVSRNFLAFEACSEVPTLIQGFPRRTPRSRINVCWESVYAWYVTLFTPHQVYILDKFAYIVLRSYIYHNIWTWRVGKSPFTIISPFL